MIVSLKKAFAEFSKHPFIFIWPSLVYVALQLLFVLASVGLFLIYFLLASVLGISTGIQEIPTLVAAGIVLIIFLFFTSGLNAGLIKGYSQALEGKKITMADFFRYSLSKSAMLFAILLLREVLFLLVAGWVVAAFVYFDLGQYQYVDILVGAYVLFSIFIIHFLFTPAFISAGALETRLFQSMRNSFRSLRKKHIYALGLYIVFAFIWILNFIPFIQLFTLFALYPIVYSAFIVMLKDSLQR